MQFFLRQRSRTASSTSCVIPASYVSYKDLKALMADLKAVYAAVDEQAAMDALDAFGERWDKKYPKITQSWRSNWANLSTYFKYPQEVRRLIYTTNAMDFTQNLGLTLLLRCNRRRA